jgi:lipoprotein-releasing system permease protein
MSYYFFLSKRFISPRQGSKFISFITLAAIIGVALGVAALIISVSVLNGFEKEITSRTVALSSDIQITTFKRDGIEDYQSVINTIRDPERNLGIVSAHPYVQREAVIKFKDKTDGIFVKGVRNVDSIFSSQRKIINGTGNLLRIDSNTSSIVIGNKLFSKLGIPIGGKVFIIATVGLPSPTNTPTIKQFIVTGIYESSLQEYDDVWIYVEMGDAQKLFDMKENVTGIELVTDNIDKIQETTNELKRILGYPYYPQSVFKLYKGLFTWVELQKKPIPIILGLISIVAAFNIVAFLLMIVLEKTETIGILKSLGAANRDIIRIFFYQGMFISIIGIILGNLLGYGLCFLQLKYDLIKIPEIYYMTHVPLLIQLNTGILITIVTLLLSVFVSIIPSYLASKLNPITILRFK